MTAYGATSPLAAVAAKDRKPPNCAARRSHRQGLLMGNSGLIVVRGGTHRVRPAPWPSQTRSRRQSSAISLMLRLGWTAALVRTCCGTPGLFPDAGLTPVHPSRLGIAFRSGTRKSWRNVPTGAHRLSDRGNRRD